MFHDITYQGHPRTASKRRGLLHQDTYKKYQQTAANGQDLADHQPLSRCGPIWPSGWFSSQKKSEFGQKTGEALQHILH